MRTALVLTLGLTLFLGVSVSVGVMLWRDPPRSRTSTSPLPGSRSSDSPGQLDLETRVATIGTASLTLPDEPYVLTQDPKRATGLFDVLFLANAPVHARYDSTRTWAATVTLARISPSVGPGGLEDQAGTALARFAEGFFDGHPTKLTDVRGSERTVSGCAGMLMTAQVHYAVDQLPSRYDRVTALVVDLPGGGRVMAISSVPDDADPALEARAEASLATLTIG